MTGIMTSVHGGFILSPSTKLVEYDGVSAYMVRDVVVNNLLHTADQAGQVRVNWSSEVGVFYEVGNAPIDTDATLVRVASLGYFPLTIRHDGQSYYVRTRIGLASADGSTIEARLVMQSWRHQQEDANNGAILSTPLTNVSDVQFSSTTPAWIDGGSIYLTASQVDEATSRMNVANTTLEVASSSTEVVMVYATLWSTPVDAPNIEVYGCYMAEVLDADPVWETA